MRQEVAAALARLVSTASAAGIDASCWVVAPGSKTYGRAFRLHRRDPRTGGLAEVIGGGGYLGMTSREAVAAMDHLRAGLLLARQDA